MEFYQFEEAAFVRGSPPGLWGAVLVDGRVGAIGVALIRKFPAAFFHAWLLWGNRFLFYSTIFLFVFDIVLKVETGLTIYPSLRHGK